MKTTLFLAVSLTLFSCHKKESQAEGTTQDLTIVDSITTAITSETVKDTIHYDTLVFPNIGEEDYAVKTLQTGWHHGDEVPDNAAKLSWLGLFKGKDGYYIAKTGISVTNVYDPVVDETETEKTGREVKTTVKDTSVILISGCDYITGHKVNHITPEKNEILPGETLTINFKGKDYSLRAVGGSYKRDNDVVIYNYKLSITGERDGETTTTLLVSVPQFDDSMIQVLFIGDIDGDDIPDLILDTAAHYNAESPTLYLSKSAGDKELLKPVSVNTYTGC